MPSFFIIKRLSVVVAPQVRSDVTKSTAQSTDIDKHFRIILADYELRSPYIPTFSKGFILVRTENVAKYFPAARPYS